jgi:AraC-like DNA-binding protein
MDEQLLAGMRGLAVGLALALILAGAGLGPRVRWSLWPVPLCLVAYLLRSAPPVHGGPLALLLPLSVGALLFPVAFWWLVHSAFDDRADVPRLAWAASAALLAAGLLGTTDELRALQKVLAASFVVAALWRLWRGAAGDLVPGRRLLRPWLLAYIGAHGLAVLAVELRLRGQPAPAWLEAVNVMVIGLALAVALALLLGFRPDALERLFGRQADLPASPATEPAPPDRLAEDAHVTRLEQLMSAERAYGDPALSLARLAERVGLPEYRLRELIHHRLGYRNFPAFVNAYRLREVEQRLADPSSDRLPILTLALDAGFGSIGPFNRAFRERHGMTPSEYRAATRQSRPLTGPVSG